MGNILEASSSTATTAGDGYDDDGNEGDAEDVWYLLVEEAALHLPGGVVMSWNKAEIRELVLKITDIDLDKHWDLNAAAAANATDTSAGEHKMDALELQPLPTDVAKKLLRVDPKLAPLRFRLVPSRIKEHEFWQQYFECVIRAIKRKLSSR